ncbi:MAG: ThuA domain-containing protein [Planctomycetota bacterium]|jgi:type 1 glutamine amidotransferase
MEKLRESTCHHTKNVVKIVVCLLILFAGNICLAKGNVLIYTKNGKGYVHKNIAASVKCLKSICLDNNWTCEATDDASVFTAEKIKAFDVLVFSNTNNEAFDTEQQKKVFQDYIRNGGGFVGIHSACGSERDWPWFWSNLGGKFVRHPKLQPFDIKVIDVKHPSTNHLGDIWKWEDECYFMNHLNPDIHVLLAVDLKTIKDDGKAKYPGEVFGAYFPLCWYHEFDGGRQWYTALGHKDEHYKDENFKKHLAGGIRWAMTKNQKKKNPGSD